MALVFVSCGQHHPQERAAADAIRTELRQQGFDVYVAVRAQSIEDVNSGIIRQLKRADYYVFIDFARDMVGAQTRGSLFTNQELAIAYVLGFDRVLFFQQSGMKLEGLLRYMGANATTFESPEELPSLIVAALREREWTTDYSRHLATGSLRWDGPITYGEIGGRFLYGDIVNRRMDVAAFETVARLMAITTEDTVIPSTIRSPLKVTGAPAYEQTIWPGDHGSFDLLAIDAYDPTRVLLNSALDVTPLPSVIDGIGEYALHYAVLARDFPILQFIVDLVITGNMRTTTAQIRTAEEAVLPLSPCPEAP